MDKNRSFLPGQNLVDGQEQKFSYRADQNLVDGQEEKFSYRTGLNQVDGQERSFLIAQTRIQKIDKNISFPNAQA